jgi:hypothetical protein
MKTLIFSVVFAIITSTTFAGHLYNYYNYHTGHFLAGAQSDSLKLKLDGEHAYYQKVVKVDSNLRESTIFIRIIQFMASKNFQQTYGYQEEGKLIFTTTQDLNNNLVSISDESDQLDPYTVQFAITLDVKNGNYRYTIHDVIFYLPTDNGNRRENLYDIYVKATNTESRRVAKEGKKLIDSFERYITTLTNDLYDGVEQKSVMYKSKF